MLKEILTQGVRFPEKQDRFHVEDILDKSIWLCRRNRKPVAFYLIRQENVGQDFTTASTNAVLPAPRRMLQSQAAAGC